MLTFLGNDRFAPKCKQLLRVMWYNWINNKSFSILNNRVNSILPFGKTNTTSGDYCCDITYLSYIVFLHSSCVVVVCGVTDHWIVCNSFAIKHKEKLLFFALPQVVWYCSYRMVYNYLFLPQVIASVTQSWHSMTKKNNSNQICN